MKPFEPSCQSVLELTNEWESRLLSLSEELISKRTNSQNRTIRQILGHLVDSASNNTHRIIHMQYRESPCSYPNYATQGNNDRWIAIQDYQHESRHDLIQLWKYSNLHLVHVIRCVDLSKLSNQWQSSETQLISLQENIEDYLPHLVLHLKEIGELMKDQ